MTHHKEWFDIESQAIDLSAVYLRESIAASRRNDFHKAQQLLDLSTQALAIAPALRLLAGA